MSFDSKPGDKRRDLRRPKLARVAPAVEHDEVTNPMDAGVLGSPTIVPRWNRSPDLIKETRCCHSHPHDDDAIVG